MCVILDYDGYRRTYNCESMGDLIVLRDALEHRYGAGCVSAWCGMRRL